MKAGFFLLILVLQCIALGAIAAEFNIIQVNQKFSKSSLAVAVGDQVTFSNQDDVTHNINVIPEGSEPEDQGLQKPGEVIHYTFSKAGTYEVRCSIHPRMKMSVEVK